jgi:hypothetical protein
MAVKLRPYVNLIGILSLIFLGVFHQPYYPTTWFDEGLVLQGAINLVQHGQYAMRSVEGFRVLDQPLTANGPGVVLPITGVFAIFGIGLLQARLLMALYFVSAVLLFHKVAASIFGKKAALVSTLALLAVPDEGILLYGRQALGNVPALVYFLAGCYFLILLVEKKKNRFAVVAGLFWGITLVTKSQYWVILPVLVGIVFLDLVYYKQIGLKSGLIMLGLTLGGLVLWQFVQYLLIGSENYAQYVESIRSSAKETVFAFRAIRIPGNIWYLVRSGFALFVIPGLIIAVWYSIRQNLYSIVQAFLILFVLAWTVWYVFVSVGWHRYAFEAYSVGMIFFGLACRKAFQKIVSFQGMPTRFSSRVYGFAVILILLMPTLWGVSVGLNQIQRIVFSPEPYPQQFARYLQSHVSETEVIESWEWEIDALTPNLTYHHPTNDLVDRKTAELQFGEAFNAKYDFFAFNPSYLIDGPFSKWTGMYKEPLAKGCCMKVTEVGDYTLYKVIKPVE